MRIAERVTGFSRRVEARYPALGRVAGPAGVHVLEDGPAGALPIVLVHGASGNLRDFALSVLPGLAQRHRVVAADRPGFGYSASLPEHGWRLSDQVAALRMAVHALGYRRYLLAGHSYGGTVVMRWVLEHPDEVAGVLALSAPVMDWGGGGLGLHYAIGGRPLIGTALAEVARVLAGPEWVRSAVEEVFAPDPVPPRYLTEGGVELALRPRTFRTNSVMMLKLHSEIVEQQARYGGIACPVEIVHGDADTIVPASIHAVPLARTVPGAQLTLLPGIGHMPHHVRPGEVIAAIDRLAQAASRTSAD